LVYAARIYVPIIVVTFLIGGLAIYISMGMAELRNQAATFDLNKLEQMESASVILDRNNKIFGQIYVENRETIPTTNCHAIWSMPVAVEDAKFYQHHGYSLSGIVRAGLKNLVAGHVRQGASTITQQLARNSFALKGKTFRRKLLEIFVARRIEDNFNKQKILELISTGFISAAGFMARKQRRAVILGNGARSFTGRMRHARRINQESEPAFTVDGQGRIA